MSVPMHNITIVVQTNVYRKATHWSHTTCLVTSFTC